MSWQAEVAELARRRELALALGGEERIARHHAAGRLTVRERIEALVDPGSLQEIGSIAGKAIYREGGDIERFTPAPYVAGLATIGGRQVVVGGEDFTVRGGSEGRGAGQKSQIAEKMAKEFGIPLVLLQDASGANIEYLFSAGYTAPPNGSDWGALGVELLGLVPVVVGVVGSVAGGPAGRAILSHWSCMVKSTSELFAAGPPVVKRAIGRDIDKHELGGSHVHAYLSGVADNEAEDEYDCFRQIREFLSYFPPNVWQLPPYVPASDPPDREDDMLLSIIPKNRRRSYDMRRVIAMVVDDGRFFEVQPHYGACLITSLARINGHSVGVIANNPLHNGGALDAAGAMKMCHFMELCDYFNIPLLHLVDVPGLMIGPQAEQDGTLRHGMRAFWMSRQLTVPVITVIVRRCYGMAGAISGTAPSRLTLRIAWPSGEWGSIPIEGGVDAAFRRDIAAAADPDARRREIEAQLTRLRSPFATAEALGIEEMIDPRKTRAVVSRFLDVAVAGMRPAGPKNKLGVRP